MSIDLKEGFLIVLKSIQVPEWLARIIWIPIPILTIVILATLGVLVIVWLERKISAAVQQRIGPEFAGPLGILQSLADGLKLIFKEEVQPTRADNILFSLGPCLVLVPVFVSYLVVPFGENLIIADLPIGIFLWISLSSIAPIGLLMSGYGSSNKYSFLGGLRAAAQSISYEIPLALSILAICLITDSLSSIDIINQQNSLGILTWNVWRQPIGFVIFLISALAECERLPFDLPEAEEELVAGYQTEYSGIKFGLFYIGSYVNLLLSSLFVTILYLGGWSFFIPISEQTLGSLGFGQTEAQVVLATLGIFMTLVKTYLFLFFAILTRWTFPRVRIDQLLNLGWKFLLPISLGNLLITAAVKIVFI